MIVTSVYQGKEEIKVRDFHNLIGRAGRAGMHTEGSVLFADPNVFDGKTSGSDRWRWPRVKALLDFRNSEPCLSNILTIFDPILSDDKKYHLPAGPLDFVREYLADPRAAYEGYATFARANKGLTFSEDGVRRQIDFRVHLIAAIESFLMSSSEADDQQLSVENVSVLAERTLAYALGTEIQKGNIIELFKILAANISTKVISPVWRKSFGRTLFGVNDGLRIYSWVVHNFDSLANSDDDFIDVVWPLLSEYIRNKAFSKYDKPELLSVMARRWIMGFSFSSSFDLSARSGVQYIWGTRRRDLKVEHIVDICENGFSYHGALLIGALIEMVNALDRPGSGDLAGRLKRFQKRLKYGLPTMGCVSLFELGFSDRGLASELAAILKVIEHDKSNALQIIRFQNQAARAVLSKYPSIFRERLELLLS